MKKIIYLLFFCACLLLHAIELERPRIEVSKSKRELKLYDSEKLIKTYRIALGSNPIPPKEREGDRATPEGTYFICNKNPQSQFYLSLGISYPGQKDAERGLLAGLISEKEKKATINACSSGKIPPWNTLLGGEVFIHGKGSSRDWTWGCIALDDSDIEELYKIIPVGTKITINP